MRLNLMSNPMEISPKFLGLRIDDDGNRYEYSYRPFTQNSKLFDCKGNLVAELRRFGWFTLNFHLIAESGEYLLKCRALNHELTTPQGELFHTGMSVNFSNKTEPLTKLSQDNRSKKYAILEVLSKHHRMALTIASCLLTVRYLHGGNYS